MAQLDDSWQNDIFVDENWQDDTLAIRAGQYRTMEGEHNEAIFATSSYVYKDAQTAADHFNGNAKGNVYSRHTNPSVRLFERRLASLEGGSRCVATGSGMAAILALGLAFLQAGEHMVCAKQVFGSTRALFDGYFAKFGVQIDYVDVTDTNAWQNAMRPNTRMLFLESPSNPLGQVGDIQKIAQIAHSNNALLCVDNCFATPILQKPLSLGADIVMHSASKYIDGQGRVLGGALIGADELMEQVFMVVRTAGTSLSPFNAWVLGKGLETLHLRMQAHCNHALQVANFLHNHPKVACVHYAGLPQDANHAIAQIQMRGGFGGIVSFEVKDRQSAWRVIDGTRLVSITNNLGDAKTTITHPASTTHFRLSPQERLDAGVVDGLIRLSVGLENPADIIKDLENALALI